MVKRLKKKKKSKKIFFIAIFLLLFFLPALIFLGFKIYRSVDHSLWDGQSQFNLAVDSRPGMIVSFDRQAETINVLVIPDGTFVEVIHGYGPYRIESIYKLGEIKGNGGELLVGSLQEYFGLGVDGFLVGGKFLVKEMSLKNFLLNQIFPLQFSKEKTNLSRWDQARLWWFLKRIREDKINLIDLSQTSASSEVELPDGSRAMKIDQERLERIISQFFVDPKIKEEDLSISILNKTEHFGLANKAARIISNSGGRVIQVGSEQKEDSKTNCQIKSHKKHRQSYTVLKLSRLFDCQWVEEPLSEQRAEIVLLLGEDYWEKLNLP